MTNLGVLCASQSAPPTSALRFVSLWDRPGKKRKARRHPPQPDPALGDGFTVREMAVRRVSVRPLKVVELQRRSLGVPAGTGVYISNVTNR
jgi:hypothetical protein